jgi:putative transposase
MARPQRIEFPGAVFHFAARDDRRKPIFVHDVDRSGLLAVAGQAPRRFDATQSRPWRTRTTTSPTRPSTP